MGSIFFFPLIMESLLAKAGFLVPEMVNRFCPYCNAVPICNALPVPI